MTFNTGDFDRFPKAAQIAQVVNNAGDPDIILFQELEEGSQTDELLARLKYPYHAAIPYRYVKGDSLAIFSRYPIEQTGQLYFRNSRDRSAALCCVVRPNGTPVLICSVHLDEIQSKHRQKNGYVNQKFSQSYDQLKTEIFDKTSRCLGVNQLIPWLKNKGYENIIVGGDFNTIPFSRAIREMSSEYEDSLWPSWDYFSGTYFKIISPILPRIDYIFHTSKLKVTASKIIKQSSGDHYPVLATFHIGVVNQYMGKNT
jgi:endonuclease/exonuclease/phosphatase family metal-dependent hydrolase